MKDDEPKPQIRLPDDDGPNPYDSKTGLQPKPWMRWQYWVAVICAGTAFYFMREWLGR